MKAARLVVLGVALAAGGAAYMLSRGPAPAPVKTVMAPPTETVDVLVAKTDIPVGRAVAVDNLAWQPWPIKAAGPLYIKRADRPNALEEMTGAVARGSFVAGEPIREQKLVKANGAGFMSAILPAGMRAISTEISAETGAGGFILPNDYVDVILTREQQNEGFVSEMILRNVRVLAIDQVLQEKDGQKTAVGKTATLELTPRQTETLALARRRGALSLALRSLADAKPVHGAQGEEETETSRINIIRYGVTTVQTAR